MDKWKLFWDKQSTPLHRFNTDEYYQQYASELRILFNHKAPQSVLELGCGDGMLYKALGFDEIRYKGVDFSESMLNRFVSKYPTIEVECCDAYSYQDDKKYDLIFSNGVIQYFDFKMLDDHFSCATSMMGLDSLFVCASVPWKTLKVKYMTSELGPNSNKLKGRIAYILSPFLKKTMGTWYSFSQIEKLANKHKMSATVYGSMHYPYRFHVVMKNI